MSFTEQQWTVDQVNKKIQSSDTGKDLYIMGVKRGLLLKSVSGSVNGSMGGGMIISTIENISGKGWLTYLHLSGRTSNVDVYAQLRVNIDGVIYNMKVEITGSASITKSLDTTIDRIGSSGDVSSADDIGGIVLNKPIRFENNLALYAILNPRSQYHTNGGVSTVTMNYIIDD